MQDREIMTNARKKREHKRRRSALLIQDGGSSDNGQQWRRTQETVQTAAIFDGAQIQHAGATRLFMKSHMYYSIEFLK